MRAASAAWATVAVLATGAGRVCAQEPPVLTLPDAQERAARHNPDYRMARNEIGLSGPARKAAWGAFLPDLSLSTGTSLGFNRRTVAEDFFGNPIDNPATRWETISSTRQSVSGSLTLFEGGRRFHELSVAAAEADARSAAARARLGTVEAEVSRAYVEAMRRRDLLAVEEELLESRRRDLEAARRRFELAGVTRVDVLAARQSVEEQDQAVRRARVERRRALLAVARTIGDPALDTFAVVAAPPAPVDPGILSEEALVSRALAGSPELLVQEARLSAAEAGIDAAGARRWPSLDLSYGFTQNIYARERSALFDPFPDRSRSVSTGLSLSIPVFSRFQVQDQVARAVVRAENARETLRRLRLEVEERVRSRLMDLRTAREELELARRVRELAEERLELALEQYHLGTRTFTELQRDIDAAVRARRRAIDALYGLLAAEVDLEEAVGARLGGG